LSTTTAEVQPEHQCMCNN